jgi:hypothetical protein
VGRAMLPWLIDEVVTPHDAAILYFWKHLCEIDCYSPQCVVSIDVGEVERLIWYFNNDGTLLVPEDYAPVDGKVCFK